MGHPSESDIERSKTALLEEIEELRARVGALKHAEAGQGQGGAFFAGQLTQVNARRASI